MFVLSKAPDLLPLLLVSEIVTVDTYRNPMKHKTLRQVSSCGILGIVTPIVITNMLVRIIYTNIVVGIILS